jgi:hypothetical protein
MPVTPFHGGVGLLAKGCLGGRFSFVSFCATQVVIDFESGYFLLTGQWPFHRIFHTPLGATALCTAVALVFAFLGVRIDRKPSVPPILGSLRADLAAAASWSAALLTVVAGVLGHLVPDAIMHSDVRPLWPASAANPLHGAVSLAALHVFLVAGGMLGALLIAWHARRAGRI